MVVQVRINGLDRVRRLLTKLPQNMDESVNSNTGYFMGTLQKSMKLRAPVYTGFLKDQITLTKVGENFVIDTGEAYYAYFQEFGFEPHMIPLDYLRQHMISPNVPGEFTSGVSVFRIVRKNKPFIYPALNASLANLSASLKSAVNNAIKKSRR
jgi:hypothetical protein